MKRMNELIEADLPVAYEMVKVDEVPEGVATDRLPEDAGTLVRIVRIGTYDTCLCIGNHVASTAEIGTFILLGTNWNEELKSFRIRFKLGEKA